jgi:hypothetical protein
MRITVPHGLTLNLVVYLCTVIMRHYDGKPRSPSVTECEENSARTYHPVCPERFVQRVVLQEQAHIVHLSTALQIALPDTTAIHERSSYTNEQVNGY